MSDIKLDANWDIDTSQPDLQLTTGVDAIQQHLTQRLKTFMNEWFLNYNIGIPYFEQILIKNPNYVIIDSVFKKEILETPGVIELLEFDLDLNTSTRLLSLTFKAITSEGVFNFLNTVP